MRALLDRPAFALLGAAVYCATEIALDSRDWEDAAGAHYGSLVAAAVVFAPLAAAAWRLELPRLRWGLRLAVATLLVLHAGLCSPGR